MEFEENDNDNNYASKVKNVDQNMNRDNINNNYKNRVIFDRNNGKLGGII